LIVSPIIAFERVGKRYTLHHDRPNSFRDLFVRRRISGGVLATGADMLWALHEVSFVLQTGETVGLIGANGAGKSTALKLISRVIMPTEGRVRVNGRVAALLELGTGFHPELSGRDNIFLSGALAGMRRTEMARKFASIVDFSELESFIDVPVKHYSSGMFARLAFAVSIHLEPEILLVDEVLAVGDQDFQRKCLDRIALLQRSGVSVCFVSHGLDTVRKLCSRAIWFDHGCVKADGPAESVVNRYLDHVLSDEERRLAGAAALDANQRWGSRKVEITGVRFSDSQNHERRVYATGETLVVHIDYRSAAPVASPVFGIAIHRQDGVHICGPNTAFSGFDLPTVHGTGTVTYALPDLPLLDGLYQVTAAVVNHADTEVFDYHDRAYMIRVVNRTGGTRQRFGLIAVRGEWAFAPADGP
jgi:lipopolysaccharide transport system ATP-binding protein